jgi:hypothetical protein
MHFSAINPTIQKSTHPLSFLFFVPFMVQIGSSFRHLFRIRLAPPGSRFTFHASQPSHSLTQPLSPQAMPLPKSSPNESQRFSLALQPLAG